MQWRRCIVLTGPTWFCFHVLSPPLDGTPTSCIDAELFKSRKMTLSPPPRPRVKLKCFKVILKGSSHTFFLVEMPASPRWLTSLPTSPSPELATIACPSRPFKRRTRECAPPHLHGLCFNCWALRLPWQQVANGLTQPSPESRCLVSPSLGWPWFTEPFPAPAAMEALTLYLKQPPGRALVPGEAVSVEHPFQSSGEVLSPVTDLRAASVPSPSSL